MICRRFSLRTEQTPDTLTSSYKMTCSCTEGGVQELCEGTREVQYGALNLFMHEAEHSDQFFVFLPQTRQQSKVVSVSCEEHEI